MYRTTALALAVAASLAACADATAPTTTSAIRSANGPSLAATTDVEHINQQYTISGYTQYNPCTGDVIVYSGDYHINGTFRTTDNGFDANLHLNTEDFKGVSLTTGTEYVYHQQTHQSVDFTYDPLTETFVSRVTLMDISQGASDNYRLEAVFTFKYPPGTSSYTLETTCMG